MAPQQDTGFTLIETLIVVVILGILAGIVSLGVSRFRDDAGVPCTQTNARLVATANLAYQARNHTDADRTPAELVSAGYLLELPGTC